MLVNNTPVITYYLHGRPILVKREDLCSPFPGPSFSKIRGVVAHIENREAETIGVLDTYHSKAGWAVAFVCQHLKRHAVNFWPKYKADDDAMRAAIKEGRAIVELPREQQQQARRLGAKMVSIKAGRSAILYHTARRYMVEKYPAGGYLMPNALKLPETITETAAEVLRTLENEDMPRHGTLVISVSSGTIAAGVLRGLKDGGVLPFFDVILHMGYSRSREALQKYIEEKAGIEFNSAFRIIDEKYGYADAAQKVPVEFPCNPYYDLKAWKWLSDEKNLNSIVPGPILFWNIGE